MAIDGVAYGIIFYRSNILAVEISIGIFQLINQRLPVAGTDTDCCNALGGQRIASEPGRNLGYIGVSLNLLLQSSPVTLLVTVVLGKCSNGSLQALGGGLLGYVLSREHLRILLLQRGNVQGLLGIGHLLVGCILLGLGFCQLGNGTLLAAVGTAVKGCVCGSLVLGQLGL